MKSNAVFFIGLFAALALDTDVRIILLRGAGGKAFAVFRPSSLSISAWRMTLPLPFSRS